MALDTYDPRLQVSRAKAVAPESVTFGYVECKLLWMNSPTTAVEAS